MNEDVQVKFGGTTGDLDAASAKAAADIKKVGTAADANRGAFARLRQSVSDFTGGFKSGWNEAGAAQSVAARGTQEFGTIANGVFASANGGVMGLVQSFGKLGIAAGVIGAAIGLLKFGEHFGDEAEKLDQMSQKLGMSATEVSRWGALATTAGMSTDSFAMSAQRLERAMVAASNGGKKQAQMFREIGVSAETMKQGVSPSLMAISEGFSKMENGPKKTAIAMGLMGRAGANMIPILNQGTSAIKEQMQMAEDYGAVVTDEFMQSGLAVDESMDKMTLASKGLKDMLFEALAPAILGTADGFNDLAKEMVQSYKQGGAVYTMLQFVGNAFKVIITIMGAVMTGFRELWHVAVAALAGILGSIYSVGAALKRLLSGDFSGIKTAFVNGMKGTGRAVAGELRQAGDANTAYVNRMKGMWSGSNVKGAKGKPGGAGDLDLEMGGGGGGKGGGKKGGDGVAAAKAAAEKRLRAELEALDVKMQALEDDYEGEMALEEQKLAKLKAFYGEASSEYQRELRSKAAMVKKHEGEVLKIAQESIKNRTQLEQTRVDSAATLADIELQSARDHFTAMDAMGQIKSKDRIAREREFASQEEANQASHEDAIFRIKAASIREQLALEHLPADQRRQLNAELEQQELAHQARMTEIHARAAAVTKQLNDQAAQQTQDKWKSIVDPIAGAFQSLLSGLATGSQSLGQALLAIGDQIVTSLIQMGIKAAAQWAVMELTKTSATTAGVAARTAAETTGATVGTAVSAGAAIKQIAHKAAVAAAGAYSAIASIPVVGPFLAPAAAAAALFAVYKIGSSIFSAEQGAGDVANDGDMYRLHKKEMVLPAKFANPLRSMLSGAGPQMSGLSGSAASAGASARSTTNNGGDLNFHYGPKHNNTNADLSTLLANDARAMRKWMKNEMRNGSFKMMAGT